MTSFLRRVTMLLIAGTVVVPAARTRADERAPLFVDVPPTRTAPAGIPVAAATPPVAATPPPAVTPAPAPAEALAVRHVEVSPSAVGKTVVLTLSREPAGERTFALTNPPRIVVDLTGPLTGVAASEVRIPVDDSLVSRVRTAPFQGKLRLVLDLREPATLAKLTPEGTTLTAVLASATAAAAPTPPRERAATAAPAPTAAPQTASAAPQTASDAPQTAAGAPAAESVPVKTLAARPAPTQPVPATAATPVSAHTSAPADLAPGQKISLDFKDADIQNVLRVLADVSQLNLIATDDVRGKVTLHLSEVPWQQAFELVLRTNRLEATREGNVVRISSVKRLTEEREAQKAALDAATEAEPLRVKYIRVNYARADGELIDKVRGILTERGSVTFDDRTNTVIVRDVQRGVDDASDLVRRLDVQSPQVLIESNIVEATEGFDRGLGVQWGYSYKAGPETGNPTGMNFPGTVGIGGSGLGAGVPPPGNGSGSIQPPVPFLADFPVPSGFGPGFGTNSGSALDLALGSLDGTSTLSARLTALEEEGRGRVVSRPRVITMNNVAATIQSLTILRVKLPSTGTVINTGQNGAAGSASTATEKINTGITLVVTPQVSSDGYVLMNIYAKSSQPDFSRAVDGIPSEISREANSNVLVRSGETVVLGGIYRQTIDDRETGVPYLRQIPVLGWAFKRTLKTDHKEELLVFLTPKIIETGTAALPPAERLWNERPRG